MVAVPVSPPGLEGGHQDPHAVPVITAGGVQVQGVPDVPGDQDLDGISAAGRHRGTLRRLLIGPPEEGRGQQEVMTPVQGER